jgi:hypothetical protein
MILERSSKGLSLAGTTTFMEGSGLQKSTVYGMEEES